VDTASKPIVSIMGAGDAEYKSNYRAIIEKLAN